MCHLSSLSAFISSLLQSINVRQWLCSIVAAWTVSKSAFMFSVWPLAVYKKWAEHPVSKRSKKIGIHPPKMVAKRLNFVLFSLISSRNGQKSVGVANALQPKCSTPISGWVSFAVTCCAAPAPIRAHLSYHLHVQIWYFPQTVNAVLRLQSVCKQIDDSAHPHVFILVRHWHSASTPSSKCQQWHVLFSCFLV